MLSRRQFLTLAGAGGAGFALAGCGGPTNRPAMILPTDPIISATEKLRRVPGARVHDVNLTAGPATIDLAGIEVDTWAFNGSVPGPEIRVRAGDVVRARLQNGLPEETTIHWHGIAIRNDMDGVPGITQQAIPSRMPYEYEFIVPQAGTFWYHPHVGMHTDTGLYAPLIVEDPNEPGAYDHEYVVVLDDWIDGLATTPLAELEKLQRGEGGHAAHMAHMEAGGGAEFTGGPYLGGAHPGDVAYPFYLINGHRDTDPVTFQARPGDRIRFRLVNAASDTPFRVAIGGHEMVVTHTDGMPINPVRVDNLVIAMAERYDVEVTVGDSGVFPIVAVAEAKGNQAFALLRSGSGSAPGPTARPAELDGKVLDFPDMVASRDLRLPGGRPDRLYALELGEGEGNYVWTINGDVHGEDTPLEVEQGEKVRLAVINQSVMFHPLHLHGHHFQVVNPDGSPGARKDTAIVRPDHRLAVDFVCDNPGQWMLHCHNIYHQQSGMMTSVVYVTDDQAQIAGDIGERAAGGSTWQLVCDYLGRGRQISTA